MTSLVNTKLVDKYSKYVKTIRNRIVEVEFYWFQVNPRQSYRLRINEKEFNEVQKHMRSKKLLNLNFEHFTDLITPIFANDAAEFSNFVLRSTFDNLFDLNSNGTVEQEEFESLFLLLQGFNTKKQNLLQENLRQMLGNRHKHISFTEFCDFVKSGHLRQLFMRFTALIISSLNGFGLNIVRKFAKQGCNIVVNGNQIDENIIKTIQNEYQQSKTIYISDNIQNEIDIHKLVEQIFNYFQHIDMLIINNECNKHYRASIDEFPTENWRDIIEHNLILNFALVKTLWPYMKRQHYGRIINIEMFTIYIYKPKIVVENLFVSNEHSLVTGEYKSACITSHHALLGLIKAISIEGAPFGITSNIICPGHIKTNFFEQHDYIKTLADLVLFLCSDQAHSITGQSIPWCLT
ncbi:unnamed protein product [Rotaria sp. Silwood1]|nr:unnamed protein product [Rotaria sp. Silwood1]CAF4645944.1 unnamed protein product [Rotaria sp. Silwood1]